MALSKIDGMKPRLLQDFIIPHLEEGTFRDKLHWVDKSQKVFRISWKHQSSSRFSPEDSCVFQHWAIVKGLWNPCEEKCHTKAKQRLRAALLKLKSVQCISKDSESRTYRILSNQGEIRPENNFCIGEPLLENRSLFQYHVTQPMEVPQEQDLYQEELENEFFMNYILDSSSDSLKENFVF